ncbi:membrane-bound lytic murein transglycosylase D [Halospina denitrificans]|uniref:Membrane-bound lytic murein transglycosylase D n=1 Tax=Halospina denitrificans TaxID=332522 RepID=A0A4R7JUD2_9GAMM|nr:LysM peptidoglycan-binding domain-containing protein [Halospina denitrificans]TDT41524.1 membrane-bound lytic murein transglycosylase D [Halospina denitrificans]
MHYFPILCLISAISVPLLNGCESISREQGSTPSDPVPTVMRAAQLDANVKRTPGATPKTATGSAASEKVVEAEPTIWDRMRSRFRLDLDSSNPRVQSQLNWYSSNQRYMDRTAQRAKRYLPYILNELEARDMPGELALLPLVESAYDPFAYSHGRASGLWQFIPSTGRAFGMGQNWWYDGRRDIVASTQGALSYLKQLADRFDGDYKLALASYNAGGARVARAVRRNQRQGRPTDFSSLQLPRETRHYVPKLIALARIIQNPEAHGIELPEIANKPYFEVVDIGGQMDLAQAADMAGVEVNEIYRLNPGFNRWATAPNGPHRLLIPAHASEQFRAALENMPPEERVSWRNYTVESGDTLIGLARQFNTTPDVIRNNNKLRGHTIRKGQTLLIPVAGKSGNFYALSEQKRRQSRQAASGGSNQSRIDYRVTSGDTLWDIASAHDVSVQKLAKWNSMAPGDPIKPGDQLAIWSSSANAGKTLGDKRDNMVRRVGYTVRSGDSLRQIANRFNVGVSDITQWNDLNMQDYLQPGQQLKLFVDIRNTH